MAAVDALMSVSDEEQIVGSRAIIARRSLSACGPKSCVSSTTIAL